MKKFPILLFVIILLGFGWFWGKDLLYGPIKQQLQYKRTQIERKDMVITVSATGALSALVTVEVGTEVSGQIKELLVDYNTPVSAGQIIARIDPESYETLLRQAEAELTVAEAGLLTQKTEILRYEADLENARANWAAARAQVKKANISLENAKRELERQRSLVKQGYVSEKEFDQTKTTHREAEAQLEQVKAQATASECNITSAKAALAIAKVQINEAKAKVALKIASKDKCMVELNNTIIRSPVDGVVIDRDVDVGQTVAASLSAPTLFTIAQDLRKMQVSTYVDEADIGRIKEGQVARFTVDAFGTRQFTGSIRQVRKMGTTVQNVVTYEVIIATDNSDMSLLPGMTADVQIELLKRPQVLVVANAALRFKPADMPEHSPGPSKQAFGGGLPNGGPPRGHGGRPDTEAKIKDLTERLNLTQAQQDRLRAVFQQAEQKMRSAFQAGGDHGPGGRGAIKSKIRKEMQASILRLLDSGQRQSYEKMDVQGQSKRGTVWRLDEEGKLHPLHVICGAGDSLQTEVSGPEITEGLEVISGIVR